MISGYLHPAKAAASHGARYGSARRPYFIFGHSRHRRLFKSAPKSDGGWVRRPE